MIPLTTFIHIFIAYSTLTKMEGNQIRGKIDLILKTTIYEVVFLFFLYVKVFNQHKFFVAFLVFDFLARADAPACAERLRKGGRWALKSGPAWSLASRHSARAHGTAGSAVG